MSKPIFLDCEASSLSSDSYPVEIAWSDEEGEIESHLINPYSYPDDYTNWDPQAQAIHGLSRNYLSKNGEHCFDVAKRMNEVLAEKDVYTDAADFDGFWCRRLFEAANLKMNINFKEMDFLLEKILPTEFWFWVDNKQSITLLKEEARINCKLKAHRAANDVAYLIELYKLAQKKGGYYG